MRMPNGRESFTVLTAALLATELVSACGSTAARSVVPKQTGPAAATAKPNKHTVVLKEHSPAVSVTKPNKQTKVPEVTLPCMDEATYAGQMVCLVKVIRNLDDQAPSYQKSIDMAGDPVLQVGVSAGVIDQLITGNTKNFLVIDESDLDGQELEINSQMESGGVIETDCLDGSSNSPVQHEEYTILGSAELTQINPGAASIVKIQLHTAAFLVAMAEGTVPYQSPSALQDTPGC
jgi:hypothetical protein